MAKALTIFNENVTNMKKDKEMLIKNVKKVLKNVLLKKTFHFYQNVGKKQIF